MEFFKLMPYFLLIISVIFIGMALFMFLRKKPLILNSVWMLIVMCLCFLPQILLSIEMLFKYPSFIGILPILMFMVLIVWFVFIMRGYIIYGVDGSDFQKLFIECLNDKNYDFDQSLATIKIKNPEIELSIAVQSWVGTAQIRFKGKENGDVLKSLISDLNQKDIKANYIFPIFYALIGVLITILSISMIIK
jgi:hypothetical protein